MAENPLTNKLSDWRDKFLKEHVQPYGEMGDFLSAESVVLFSGPPIIQSATAAQFIPIGLVQSAQVSQGKQIQQLFEIGSRLPIMVPGRTQIQAQLSRVLFDGPSLMKVMYVQLNSDKFETPILNDSTDSLVNPTSPFNSKNANDSSGNGQFWINLASNLFNKPLGLGFALYDMETQAYGGFYLENSYIRSHVFGVSSQQTVLAESISIIATQLRPLSVTEIGGTDSQS